MQQTPPAMSINWLIKSSLHIHPGSLIPGVPYHR